jgi:hypothetical protein
VNETLPAEDRDGGVSRYRFKSGRAKTHADAAFVDTWPDQPSPVTEPYPGV